MWLIRDVMILNRNGVFYLYIYITNKYITHAHKNTVFYSKFCQNI